MRLGMGLGLNQRNRGQTGFVAIDALASTIYTHGPLRVTGTCDEIDDTVDVYVNDILLGSAESSEGAFSVFGCPTLAMAGASVEVRAVKGSASDTSSGIEVWDPTSDNASAVVWSTRRGNTTLVAYGQESGSYQWGFVETDGDDAASGLFTPPLAGITPLVLPCGAYGCFGNNCLWDEDYVWADTGGYTVADRVTFLEPYVSTNQALFHAVDSAHQQRRVADAGAAVNGGDGGTPFTSTGGSLLNRPVSIFHGCYPTTTRFGESGQTTQTDDPCLDTVDSASDMTRFARGNSDRVLQRGIVPAQVYWPGAISVAQETKLLAWLDAQGTYKEIGTLMSPEVQGNGGIQLSAGPRVTTDATNSVYFFGYLQHDGTCTIAKASTSTNVVAATFDVTTTSGDDHAVPYVCQLADGGALLAVACLHNDADGITFRLCADPIAAFGTWGDEYEVDLGDSIGVTAYSYGRVHKMLGEGTNGEYWCTYRGDGGGGSAGRPPCVSKLTLDAGPAVPSNLSLAGGSWGTAQPILGGLVGGQRPYVTYKSDGSRKLHVLWTSWLWSEGGAQTMHYMVYDAGTWKDIDGNDLGSLPIDYDATGTQIASGLKNAFPDDIAIDPVTGALVALLWEDHPQDTGPWRVRHFNAMTRTTNTVSENYVSHTLGYVSENSSRPGANFHPDDSNVVVAAAGADTGVLEVYKFTTADGGTTWARTDVTIGSGGETEGLHHFRPCIIPGTDTVMCCRLFYYGFARGGNDYTATPYVYWGSETITVVMT